jgi:hypothetical protein
VDGSVVNGLYYVGEEVFVNALVAAVDVTQHMVGDVSAYQSQDGFGRTLFGSDRCLNGVVAVISLRWVASPAALASVVASFRILSVVIRSVDWIRTSSLVWASMRSFMPCPGCVSL